MVHGRALAARASPRHEQRRARRFLLRRHGAAVSQRPALAGTATADVCVVGGGIAGCSTALHLALRGYSVVLLEEHRIGWGASGRSGAQALSGVACGQDKLEQLIGAADARRVWDVSVEGLALQRELIATHGIDCDYVAGALHVAIKARQDRDLRAELDELHGKLGYDAARMVERDELRTLLQTDRYVSAILDSNSGHLHPLNYTLGLAAAAERHGVRICEGSRVSSYEQGDTVRVVTAGGEVRCRHLALCGNAYIGTLTAPLHRRIMAVGTYVIATAPLGAERARQLIANNVAVADCNWVLDYFRLSADHRLLFGGASATPAATPSTPRRRRGPACSRCTRNWPTRTWTMPGAATSTSL